MATSNYLAYLIRFQCNNAQKQWRVTLINVHTGEQRHFTSEDVLFTVLKQELIESQKQLGSHEDENTQPPEGLNLGLIE